MVHIASIVLSSLYMLSAKLHKCMWLLSQSWLDSICRDSTNTQYMTKQTLKISKILNLYFIPTYCSSSSVFIMNNTPSGAKNTKPESHLETKMFFFLFWLASSLCAWLFLHKQQHFTLSSAPAHNFFTWSLTRWFELVTEELWLHLRRHFFTCMHVYKSLSNERIHYSRLLNYKYDCVHKDKEVFVIHMLTWCLNRAWSMILQLILHTSM